MRFSFTTLLAAASVASLSVANPTRPAVQNWAKGARGQASPDHTSLRPTVACHPHHPRVPPPRPPPRNRVCYVKSHNDGVTDDSKHILHAFHHCNNGGHVVFREGVKYFIATAMDWTFLNHIDIGMAESAAKEPPLLNS